MKRGAIVLGIVLIATRADAGERCVETGDVVGERTCSRYGDGWAIERQKPVTFRFGFRYAEVSTAGATFKEVFHRKTRPKNYVGYRFPAEALGVPTLVTAGVDGGFTVFVWGQLYAGVEGSWAYGAADTRSLVPTAPSTGPLLLRDAAGLDVWTLHGGIPIGYRVPLGRASIRGEAVFGGISAEVTQRAVKEDGTVGTRSASALRGLVETRAAADIWFTQHISFGAYGGINMLDTRARAFGLSLTVHLRAFDGDMSIF